MRRVLRIAIPAAFYLALVIFLAYYLTTIDWDTIANIRFDWWFMIVASVLGLTSRYWGAWIWIVILRSLGAKRARFSTVLVAVYAKSWLGRYIPGTAPWILGKIYFASREGISRNKLAVSSLLEAALQIVVQVAIALALLLFDPRVGEVITSELRVLMLLALVGCVIAVFPPVFNRLMAMAYRLLKKGTLDREHYAGWGTIGSGAGLYVVGTLLNGLSLFFIAKSTFPALEYDLVWFVMGAATLAGVAGMLAIFIPSGLGVREGIQTVLLALVMPVEIALVIAVVSRLWSVAIDLVFFGAAWVLNRIRGGNTDAIAAPDAGGVPSP